VDGQVYDFTVQNYKIFTAIKSVVLNCKIIDLTICMINAFFWKQGASISELMKFYRHLQF